MRFNSASRRATFRLAAFICLPLFLASCSDLAEHTILPKGEPDLRISADGTNRSTKDAAVPIILDTDYGFDVDDIGALAVLNALADNGEAKILATITSVTDDHAPGAMDAVNTYYGRPNVPLGQNTSAPASYRWNKAYPYWRKPAPHFIAKLDKRFPHNTNRNVPSATSLYRKTLASQPDNSVTVVVVGFTKNLADLLKSSPDSYSKLSGGALINRKVRKLVVMGGGYPSNEREFNLTSGPGKNASDAQLVIKKWPSEIVFTPGNVCGGVFTGQTLTNSKTNPVAHAYKQFFGRQGRGRASWDLCSVLYAVRGLHAPNGDRYFKVATGQRLILERSGQNRWVRPRDPRHIRLTRVMPTPRMQNILNGLLTQPPE